MKTNFINKILPKDERLSCLYGFLLFLMMSPSYLWAIHRAEFYIFIAVFIINIYKRKDTFRLGGLDLLVLLFLFLFYIYATQHRTFNGTIIPLLFLSYFIVKDYFLLVSYKYFKIFLATSLLLSILFFILYLCSINLPYKIIEPLNTFKKTDYCQYPFFVLPNLMIERVLPRFYGMFDEPGVVGTFVGVILFIEKYNFKKKTNIIFLISGILSFSFFFYLLTALGLLICLNGKKRILACSLFILLFLFTKNIPEINSMIWKRMEFENNGLVGDNRSSKRLDYHFQDFIGSPDFLWGEGVYYADSASASYKQLLIGYGVIFCALFVFSFFLLAYDKTKSLKYVMLSMILIVAILYQRPFIFSPICFFILYIPIIVFKYEKRMERVVINQKLY